MKKYIFTIISLSLIFPINGIATPSQNVRPVKQFPMLCGPTIGEMVLRAYGVNRVGLNNEYLISYESRGSAVGQYICDLLDKNEIRNKQPKCLDKDDESILVYRRGRPTSKKSTRIAFKKGTWLSSLRVLFHEQGLKTKNVKSVLKKDGRYRSDLVKNNFHGFIKELEKGRLVIFHIGYGDGVMGHYLLAHGYDKQKDIIHYIDPGPSGKYPARASISFSKMKEGKPWYSKGRFWTGRYLSVGRT